jgi:hypothetical protein
VKRLALGAGKLGKLLGLAENQDCLVGNFLAKGSKPNQAPSALHQCDSEQRFKLSQARRQSGLRYKARFGRFSEVPVPPEGDEVLKLFDGRQVHYHLSNFPINVRVIMHLND